MSLASNAIITLAEAKLYLEQTETTHDAVIEMLINGVSSLFEDFTQRKIVQQTVTDERHDGTGLDQHLRLRYAPVVSVTSLYDDPTWGFDSSTLLVEDTDYVVDKESGVIWLQTKLFQSGKQNIKCTYDAGWATVPEAIKLAAKMQVAEEFNKYEEHRLDSGSRSVGDGSESYVDVALTSLVKLILDRWRLYGK